ncbi:MAG: tripartite tricarboxylate transporter substrate binding protein [Burkholderiales bacterium]|nr:tripartite tricarboxylate transporter substrate binding protein [Burkholderiales bacterium]
MRLPLLNTSRLFVMLTSGIVAAVAAAFNIASASDVFPNKPIKFIVPYAAGGATDTTARLVSKELTAILGQPVIVENKAGAGGNIGTDYVAKSAPDGYTMLLAYTGPMAINPSLYDSLPFKPQQDFAPVTLLAQAPQILGVHPSIPVTTVDELVAYAKANPTALFFGSSGNGGADHLAGELFKMRTGAQITHVPYKGGAPALADLVAGRTQMQFMTIPASIGHIQSGRIRPLGYGVVVAAGTPPAIVNKLNVALIKALRSDDIQTRFSGLGLVPVSNTPEEFQRFIVAESARWAEIIRVSGASLK